MCAVRLLGSRLRWIDRLWLDVRTVTSSPMYWTSFGPTRTLLSAFVAGATGFGEVDAVSEAGAGFPGISWGMDDGCSMAFALGSTEGATMLAGWDGL